MQDDLSDFSTSGKTVRRLRLSISGLIWVLFLVTLVFVVPRAASIYSDYGVDLPGPTILVLRATDWVLSHAPMLLVLLGAAWVMQDALSAWGGIKVSRAGSVLLLACPVLLLALLLIALGLPIFGIMHHLQG